MLAGLGPGPNHGPILGLLLPLLWTKSVQARAGLGCEMAELPSARSLKISQIVSEMPVTGCTLWENDTLRARRLSFALRRVPGVRFVLCSFVVSVF
jgi:hypothetical protein